MRKLRKLLQKYQDYLFPGAAGAFILVVTFKVLIPQTLVTFDHAANLKTRQEQLSKLVKKRSLLTSVVAGQTASYLKNTEAALPSEKDVASVLTAMENLSAGTQLAIDNIDLAPGIVSTESGAKQTKPGTAPAPKSGDVTTTQTRKGIPALQVSVKTRGTSENLTTFLKQVANMRRLFDIESVKIGYFPDTPNFLSAELTLYAYFLPPVSTIGGLESDLPEITRVEEETIAKLANLPYLSQSLSPAVINPQGEVGKADPFSP